MDPGERLAAYLVDELDAEERTALEAELARDAGLRARLEAIRRSDALLADLPDIAPRPAFSARLRAAVDDELEAQGAPTVVHRLGPLRWRRAWVPGLAAAAAVIAAIAVAGVMLRPWGGSGSETASTAESAAGGPEQPRALGAAPAPPGPVVLAAGTTYSQDDLEALASSAAVAPVADERLRGPEADQVAQRYTQAFSPPGAGGGAAESAPEPEAGIAANAEPTENRTTSPESSQDMTAAVPAAPAGPLDVRGDVSDADLAAVRQCLPPLLADAGHPLIPTYAELATYQGERVIVYGLVGPDPTTGDYTRVEIWAVARDSCQTRFFTQQDR